MDGFGTGAGVGRTELMIRRMKEHDEAQHRIKGDGEHKNEQEEMQKRQMIDKVSTYPAAIKSIQK